MNFVIVDGNLTRDVEHRTTAGGRHVASFGLAHSHNGHPQFFNVVAWDDLAVNAISTFVKGDHVTIIGRLEQRSWTTATGDRGSVVEIVAAEFAVSTIDALGHMASVDDGGGAS